MTIDLVRQLRSFLDECVFPAEVAFAAEGGVDCADSPTVADLRGEARRRGLWNLFSSVHASGAIHNVAILPDLAELVGRSPVLAQASLNALNPDALVAELLRTVGTPDQQKSWLPGLTDGRVGSGYCMSEPGVASSDPRGLTATAAGDGHRFHLHGTKSWCTGAAAKHCGILVVIAITEPDAAPRRRHSLLLVRRDAAGIETGDERSVLGYSDAYRGGHPDLAFHGAEAQLLGERGEGLAAAQRALGPARMVHSLRLVGTAERALGLMVTRLGQREVGGRSLADSDLWIDRVGGARIEVEKIRSLARAMHQHHDPTLAESIAKAEIPGATARIVDLAIQAHGADGLSAPSILPDLYAHARSLQISDGPDEVHRRVVGRREFGSPFRRWSPAS